MLLYVKNVMLCFLCYQRCIMFELVRDLISICRIKLETQYLIKFLLIYLPAFFVLLGILNPSFYLIIDCIYSNIVY